MKLSRHHRLSKLTQGSLGCRGRSAGTHSTRCPFPAGWYWANRFTSLSLTCQVCGVLAWDGVAEGRGQCAWV